MSAQKGLPDEPIPPRDPIERRRLVGPRPDTVEVLEFICWWCGRASTVHQGRAAAERARWRRRAGACKECWAGARERHRRGRPPHIDHSPLPERVYRGDTIIERPTDCGYCVWLFGPDAWGRFDRRELDWRVWRMLKGGSWRSAAALTQHFDASERELAAAIGRLVRGGHAAPSRIQLRGCGRYGTAYDAIGKKGPPHPA